MASLVGLTLVKRFPYRGDTTEEYSNQYHLTGAIPASSAAWKTLADALIVQEKTIYPSTCSVVRAYGYNDDAEDATSVWSWDYLALGTTVPGTLSVAGTYAPGDAAVWCRWKTSRANTRGKPIFLRKYFHPAIAITGTPDTPHGNQTAALAAFATKLWDGSFLDARTIRSRTNAETILSSGYSPYITTRTLKRRGKRPPT